MKFRPSFRKILAQQKFDYIALLIFNVLLYVAIQGLPNKTMQTRDYVKRKMYPRRTTPSNNVSTQMFFCLNPMKIYRNMWTHSAYLDHLITPRWPWVGITCVPIPFIQVPWKSIYVDRVTTYRCISWQFGVNDLTWSLDDLWLQFCWGCMCVPTSISSYQVPWKSIKVYGNSEQFC